MGLNNGPEGNNFDFYEGNTALTDIERLRLLAEIASERETADYEAGAEQVNRDPLLKKMLSKVINSGPELDQKYAAHLRKMIACRLYTMPDTGAQAADKEFFEQAISTVKDELRELESIPGAEDLPDPWDVALEDLLRLQEDEN